MIGLVLDNRYKLTDFIGQGGMLAIIAVLFVIPIIYNYTIGRKAA